MGNILVLAGSPRKDGNTDLLVKAFAKGAGNKHNVEILYLRDYDVHPCIGCNSCFSEDYRCAFQDDMRLIVDKLKKTDVLVAASPVYLYGVSAQLKTVVDRLHTPERNTFHIKKLALILVGTATIPELFDPIKLQYRMLLDFFKLEDAGIVAVGGAKEKGDVKHTDGLERAYRLGESI